MTDLSREWVRKRLDRLWQVSLPSLKKPELVGAVILGSLIALISIIRLLAE